MPKESPLIIKEEGNGLYEEKKSRFLSRAIPISDEEDAALYIEETRKKYWDARHNCYAFTLGLNSETTRCSDDGEPSGTAGKPILEVLNGSGVHNCLIIVTRYFGGTLLGTGGLVRAYTSSAKDALESAKIVRLVPAYEYSISTDYNGYGKIQYIAAQSDATITATDFGTDVRMTVEIACEKAPQFIKSINDSTNGRAVISQTDEIMSEQPY